VGRRATRRPSKVRALLRCGSCRFAAFYFLPAFAAMASVGRGSWGWALAAAAYWWVLSLGPELVNRMADRTEDEINRPERTALCHTVGFGRIATIATGCWVAVAAADVAWLAVAPSVLLGGLLLLAGLFGIGYSYGPRFKRSRYLSLLVLTFPFCGTFLVGWCLGRTSPLHGSRLHDLYSSVLPFCVVLGMTIGSLAGIKDVTDIAGDAEIGYESAWVRIVRSRPEPVVAGLLSLPSLVLVAFVASGLLPGRLLGLLALLPCSWLVAFLGRHARTSDQAAAAREIAYSYWMAFLAIALILYVPSWPLGIAAVATVVYWLVASRRFHWSRGPTVDTIRSLAAISSVASPSRQGLDDERDRDPESLP
jgi:4-hydroxybenzoate polyprenyltransferase